MNMTPQDFRHNLLHFKEEHHREALANEYQSVWELTSKLTQQVQHIQEGSTIVVNQKRAYQAALKDFIQDLRTTGSISSRAILSHLDVIKTVL